MSWLRSEAAEGKVREAVTSSGGDKEERGDVDRALHFGKPRQAEDDRRHSPELCQHFEHPLLAPRARWGEVRQPKLVQHRQCCCDLELVQRHPPPSLISPSPWFLRPLASALELREPTGVLRVL